MINDSRNITIAAIGDIHEHWDDADAIALQHLGVDLALFVGDLGNESIRIAQDISQLPLRKAVILGNHDAFYTAKESKKKKKPANLPDNAVEQQLDILGSTHVGYSYLDFPEFNFSVVGSRPFSWGGSEWKNPQFYQDYYQINNYQESIDRIVNCAKGAKYKTIIFLGHSGPYGLGDDPHDPCGKDWNPPGGDYGDPDFTSAIAQTEALGKQIPLVLFGHMHHKVKHSQVPRKSLVQDQSGRIYYNCAIAPRIVQYGNTQIRNFSLIEFEAGQVIKISVIWLNQLYDIQDCQIIYQ